MNEDLAERYAQALRETVGPDARMISFSKTGYSERHPRNVAIFNANVCVAAGKLWYGDFDLTVSEPQLAQLAARIGETVYLLYERDGRFDSENEPLLDRAVYSVTPSGHTQFQHRSFERAADGTLRRRPPAPKRRWNWQVLAHRPTLWHIWTWEHERTIGKGHSTRLSIGKHDGGATPLLLIRLTRGDRRHSRSFEGIWYPAETLKRSADKPLVKLNLQHRRLPLSAQLTIWPGHVYSLQAEYRIKQRGSQ